MATTSSRLARLRDRWRQARYWVAEFLGENEYARYVAEWSARHGEGGDGDRGHRLLSAREFYSQQCRVKFGDGIQRCC